MVIGAPKAGLGEFQLTGFFGDPAAPEFEAIKKKQKLLSGDAFDGAGMQMVTPVGAKSSYKGFEASGFEDQKKKVTQNFVSQLLAQAQADNAIQYNDPYADVKTDVRAYTDSLLNATPDYKRSDEDRQAAITGLIKKVAGQNQNYSKYQANIKTPEYGEFMGGSDSMDRTNKMIAMIRAQSQVNRKADLSYLDELLARMDNYA